MSVRLNASFGAAVEVELGTRLAQFGAQLRRGEDGDGEDLRGAQEFLRRRDDFGELVDGWAEFLLKIADAFGRRKDTVSLGSEHVTMDWRTRVLGALEYTYQP